MVYEVKEAESVSWVANFAIPDFFRIDGRSVFESLLSNDIFIRLRYNVSGIYLPLLSKVVR